MCCAVCTQARAPMNRGFPVRKVTNKVALTVILYYSLDPWTCNIHTLPAGMCWDSREQLFLPPFRSYGFLAWSVWKFFFDDTGSVVCPGMGSPPSRIRSLYVIRLLAYLNLFFFCYMGFPWKRHSQNSLV